MSADLLARAMTATRVLDEAGRLLRGVETPDGAMLLDGYRRLITSGGYRILQHRDAGRFQVVLGMRA